jgi:hypothetical protein
MGLRLQRICVDTTDPGPDREVLAGSAGVAAYPRCTGRDRARAAGRRSSATQRVSVDQTDQATWIVLADPDGNEFCVLRG